MADSQSDRPVDEKGVPLIEVTPEMLDAGIYEAREHQLGAPLADLVRNVFVAMALQQASLPPR